MLELKDAEYYSLQIDSDIFNYKLPGEEKKWSVVKINDPQSTVKVNKPTINTTKISSYSLPNTMNLNLWGSLVYTHDLSRAHIDRPKSNTIYEVNISEDKKFILLILR